ncbi:MAG: DUF2490 domain-containing protein [Bacteroidetes bacterium]|nr:DUF2490 domain-containing protein [Bacteroidota bacterium]
MGFRKIAFLLIGLLPVLSASGQKSYDTQVWADLQGVYPFANVWVFDTEASFEKVTSGQDPWRALMITPTIQRSMSPKIDLMFSVPLYWVQQSNKLRTYETRLSPAMRYTITTGGRIESRAVLRYDYRMVKPEGGEMEISNRVRLFTEVFVPINRKTFFENKQLYAITDVEGFFVMDKNVGERFANIFKTRLGLGYRLNYQYRFQFIYAFQQSRETIDQSFDTVDSIWRLRFIMFFGAVTQ